MAGVNGRSDVESSAQLVSTHSDGSAVAKTNGTSAGVGAALLLRRIDLCAEDLRRTVHGIVATLQPPD